MLADERDILEEDELDAGINHAGWWREYGFWKAGLWRGQNILVKKNCKNGNLAVIWRKHDG